MKVLISSRNSLHTEAMSGLLTSASCSIVQTTARGGETINYSVQKFSSSFLGLFIIWAILACSRSNEQTAVNHLALPTSSKEVKNVNAIIDSAEYIKLETTQNSIIKTLNAVFIAGSTIIIGDYSLGKIHFFSRQGKYLRSIIKLGEGPGEYQTMSSLQLYGDTLQVWDHVRRRMFKYDTTGKLLSELLILPPNLSSQEVASVGNHIVFGNVDYTRGKDVGSVSYFDQRTKQFSTNAILTGIIPHSLYNKIIFPRHNLSVGGNNIFYIPPYANTSFKFNPATQSFDTLFRFSVPSENLLMNNFNFLTEVKDSHEIMRLVVFKNIVKLEDYFVTDSYHYFSYFGFGGRYHIFVNNTGDKITGFMNVPGSVYSDKFMTSAVMGSTTNSLIGQIAPNDFEFANNILGLNLTSEDNPVLGIFHINEKIFKP